MYIEFKKVRYKNFLSTGNKWTTIPLNKVEKTLLYGTNGAGKSTVIDAIYFALFGKSFRKIPKPNIVNFLTKKNTAVELEFKTNNCDYKIVRTIKPDTVEVYKNGSKEPIERDADARKFQKYIETYILKMSRKLFTQIVILGSADYIPFMQLTTPARREVVESLLDISIFSVMNEMARDDMTILNQKIQNLDYEHSMCEVHISNISDRIKEQAKRAETKEKELSADIEKWQSEIEQNNSDIDYNRLKIDDMESRLEMLEDTKPVLKQMEEISGLIKSFDFKIGENIKTFEFFEDNSNCPQCSQEITNDFRKDQMDTLTNKRGELTNGQNQLNTMLEGYANKLAEIRNQEGEFHRIINESQSTISSLNASNTGLKNRIDDALNKLNEKDIEIDKSLIKKQDEYLMEKDKVFKESVKANVKLQNYNIVLSLLKDTGIKARIVKTYIPVINKLINKYLNILEFPVVFQFDENFNETIKVRGRDKTVYSNFSEGEKMRVNLALIFAFRELSVMKNATHCNLVIFDEVADSSLDNDGWVAFMSILKSVMDQNKKQNVFVISHKGGDIISKFDSNIRFYKKGGNFSLPDFSEEMEM